MSEAEHIAPILDRVLQKIQPSESVRRRNPELFGRQEARQTGGKLAAAQEKQLQSQCESLLMRQGIAYLHLSPRAREQKGWPDLTFVVRGVPHAVELKSAQGKLSDDQRRVLAQMEVNGWRVHVVRRYEAFRDIVTGGEA